MNIPRYDSATGKFQIVTIDDLTNEVTAVLHVFAAPPSIEEGNAEACREYDYWKQNGTLIDGSPLNGGAE